MDLMLLNNFNLNITKKEAGLFKLYLDILQEWNSKVNITSIKKHEDIIIKHILDSIAVIKYIDIIEIIGINISYSC